jgi:hypothetical protein
MKFFFSKLIPIFVFLEPPHDPIDDIDETAIPKKSMSRKKRRPKLSTKKEVDEVEVEHSTNYFNDEDPEFFPDPNLRLALQSLRVMSHDCKINTCVNDSLQRKTM